MKKLIAGVILLGILSSCGNKKTNIDPFASITKEVDSVRQIADSSHHDKSPEDPQPIQADESFDDFIYNFERIKGAWILEAINLRPIEQSDNENFVEFFGHFATDSLFQSQRVREPLAFVTSDPDDDFSILETTLDLNQWFAFKPVLPVDRLSNINYGQRNDDDSPTKILALKGIGNGFSNILYFRRKAGEWELYKFEDTSI